MKLALSVALAWMIAIPAFSDDKIPSISDSLTTCLAYGGTGSGCQPKNSIMDYHLSGYGSCVFRQIEDMKEQGLNLRYSEALQKAHNQCQFAKAGYGDCRAASTENTHTDCLDAQGGYGQCIIWNKKDPTAARIISLHATCSKAMGGYGACRNKHKDDGLNNVYWHNTCMNAATGYASCASNVSHENRSAIQGGYLDCLSLGGISATECAYAKEGLSACLASGRRFGHGFNDCKSAPESYGDCYKNLSRLDPNKDHYSSCIVLGFSHFELN